MWTFLNHIKKWNFGWNQNITRKFVATNDPIIWVFPMLILKRKCLVGASRVRSGESGTPSTIIYVRWSSRRYELGCDTPVGQTAQYELASACPGGGTPYVMGDTYMPRFWPPFFTLAGSSTIFLGYFFSSTNTKTIFWGIKTTNS